MLDMHIVNSSAGEIPCGQIFTLNFMTLLHPLSLGTHYHEIPSMSVTISVYPNLIPHFKAGKLWNIFSSFTCYFIGQNFTNKGSKGNDVCIILVPKKCDIYSIPDVFKENQHWCDF